MNVFKQRFDEIMAKQTTSTFTITITHRGPFRDFNLLLPALNSHRLGQSDLIENIEITCSSTKTKGVKTVDKTTELIKAVLVEAATRLNLTKVARLQDETQYKITAFGRNRRVAMDVWGAGITAKVDNGDIVLKTRYINPVKTHSHRFNPNHPDLIDQIKELIGKIIYGTVI